MTTLVTGGAGFIGSHLVDALVDRGERVVVVDDLSRGTRANLADALDAGAELVVADVTDAEATKRIVAACEPRTMLHLAAQMVVTRSIADPADDARLNVVGTVSILEAARRAGCQRVVFASTGGGVYGEGANRQLPLAEAAECLPTVPYGQSKLAAEGYVSLYSRVHGVAGASLRLGNIYGPRQDPHGEAGVIAIFCNRLLEGAQPTVYGDGEQTRDYVYVDDAVQALLAAADTPVEGIYNIGTGAETSVLQLLDRLSEIAGRESEPEMAPPRGEVRRIAIDARRALDAIGWRPATSLEDGLRRTFASYQAATASP
jgi:UDP-glucose 4-epimerase